MKRKHFRWGVAGIVILICLSCVLSQSLPERAIAIDVDGESGARITAHATVDGTTTTVEKNLPAHFEYRAKNVFLEIVGPQSTPDDYIEATLQVDDVEEGACRAPAVRIGYEGPGMFGLGSSNVLCSGMKPTELVAN